jgi:hypothetical protein
MLDAHQAVEGKGAGLGATQEDEEDVGSAGGGGGGSGGGGGGGGARQKEEEVGRERERGLEAYLPTSPRASKRRIRRILQA